MKMIRCYCRWLLVLVAFGATLMSVGAKAEDIDIYFENSSEGVRPKVLFMIDNSSNVGSQWGPGCTGYADGSGEPSMGTTTAGGIIQCALVDAINSLPNDNLDVGLMTGNSNNFARSRGCVGSSGGCLLYPLTRLNAASRPDLVAFIKSWRNNNSGETTTSFPFTVTNAESGGMMQEAWAYFYASTGLSGRSYTINHIAACQKNFIIYLGNADKTPANDEPSGTALISTAVGTPSGSSKITKTQAFNPALCAGTISSMPAGSNANDWSSNWADEWARFLKQKDGGTSTQEGQQNISTYTIGIVKDTRNQCTADYPALLQSMAVEGGGEAYRVGDAGEVKRALGEALNEVQAVNSVFSSASLPVSVNAEGSYLNQIFLGMFRPDASGAPRWLGNLKQYQLVRNSAGNLVMGDACTETGCPRGAINPSTGFLSPNAISFWTYKDTNTLPDSAGGFFVDTTTGVSGGFDRADGEVVEKGGVAQQLRKQGLTATFEGASGTTVNPRRLFTVCPDLDASCSKVLTHADNDFSTNNTRISANSFGSSVSVAVRSIVRDGSVATITTRTNHGLTGGSTVTIRNADQPEYNRTGPITLVADMPNKFTMTVPDYPTRTSQGEYTISVPGVGGNRAITSLSRTAAAGSANTETVTVTTESAHLFLPGQTVTISGNTATGYNRSWTIDTVPQTNKFTFVVPIYPVSPAQNTYQVVHAPSSLAVQGITYASGSGTYTVETSSAHGFHVGQTVTISGVKGSDKELYNKDHVVTGMGASANFFTIQPPTGSPRSAGTGNVAPSQTAQSISITRSTTAVTGATALVTGAPANWFANGQKINIVSTGTSSNEDAYVKSDVSITCSGSCTSFSYPIEVTPAVTGAGGTATIPGAGTSVNIPSGAITRDGSTATVTLAQGSFSDQSTVNISPRGAGLSAESAYVNNWLITCVPNTSCARFTFGPVTQTPALTATGSNIQAFSSNTAPDKNSMIRWLRGQDNNGDESAKRPGNGITVRPSIHGDVLHSRPLVINYGDDRGIVVFYGSNDGVYRAVNGKQSGSTTIGDVTVPAGGEFWGLVLPEHFESIDRVRSNTPELKFPSTFLESAKPKDYFVDGPTGVYQKINASGVITKAIIYLTMRRGGRFMIALDVTQPATPQFLWKIDHQVTGFEELGQTWSRPRITLLQNYRTVATEGNPSVPKPVLVFGGGYDSAQDAEPPTANSMGRGIFVVDAITGAKVFSASVSCPADSATCRKEADMKYATPSDITFVDRDQNGFTDKLYWGDLGGNLWRADVADATVANWSVTKVASLGCNAGECSSIATPRKFFFPPAVLSIRPSGDLDSYDLLSLASGDREHPLRSDASTAAFNTSDRFFVIKDLGTATTSTDLNTRNVVPSSLADATYTAWAGSGLGFYMNFVGAGWNDTTNQADSTKAVTPGEKAVNAPIAVNGQIFFATNQPRQATNTCVANLGTARGYSIDPFSGRKVRNELEGGGMPPSAVTGLISITETKDGVTKTTQEKFCIGCAVSGAQVGGTNTAPCTSALENCNIGKVIPKNLKRTYWYKK